MRTALLLLNIQNDCFPGGACPLPGAQAMVANAAAVLARFRQRGQHVFHTQHLYAGGTSGFLIEGTPGADIHPSVQPRPGEPVIAKRHPNGFRESELGPKLGAAGIDHLVICGAMTQLCIDATTRHAVDRGYRCTVLHDACAASDIQFHGRLVPAPDVHAAFMACLAFAYADLVPTEEFLAAS